MISVGVTSAYAITITFGADPVIVTGDLVVDGDIDVAGLSDSDNDSIFFDDGFATIQWHNVNDRFQIDRALHVNGDLDVVEGTFTAAQGAIINGDLDLSGPPGDDDTIFFNTIGEGSEHLRWNFADNRFEFTRGLALTGALQTSTIFDTPVLYNRLGTATATSADINAANDLLISGSLEVDGPSHFDFGLVVV